MYIKNEIKKLSLLYSGMGVLTGLLPIFMVCPMNELKGAMRCWETAKIMAFFGSAIMLIGIVMALCEKMVDKIWLHSLITGIAVVGILVPLKLVGGCMDGTMPCHTQAFPVLYGILTILLCISLFGILQSISDKRKANFAFQK